MRTPARLSLVPSDSRGKADHGWLKSRHTFSFADYYHPKRESWKSLRVINEDRVAPSQGFPTHPHRDFEIWSYVLAGEMQHKDSMGNVEVIKRGSVQFTSAGRGITHSEYNHSPTEWLHFLQVWIKPNKRGLDPGYQARDWADEDKTGKLRLILSPTGEEGSILVHQNVKVFASILHAGTKLSYDLPPHHSGYIHVADLGGSVRVNSETLRSGDGAFIHEETEGALLNFETPSDLASPVEFLFFDIAE